MPSSPSALLVALSIAPLIAMNGCRFEGSAAADAIVLCTSDDDCPAPQTCNVRFGACVVCAPGESCVPQDPRVPIIGDCFDDGGETIDEAMRVFADTPGFAAMGDTLFGAAADAVLDLRSCETAASCPHTFLQPNGQNPLVPTPIGSVQTGVDAFAPRLSGSLVAGPALAGLEEGFFIEVVFRSPVEDSGDEFSIVVSAGAGAGGFAIATASIEGAPVPFISVGEHIQVLGASLPGMWHHVLCAVDAPALDVRDDALLCVVDGFLAAFETDNPPAGFGTDAPVVFGGGRGDPAAIGARVWVRDDTTSAPLIAASTSVERQTALIVAARERLLALHGIRVEGGRIGALNVGVPRASEIVRGGFRSLALVPSSWPRTALLGQTPALVLEPERNDLLPPTACAEPVTGPGGFTGGCNGVVEAEALVGDFRPGVDRFTFSVLLAPGATASFFVDGVLRCADDLAGPSCAVDRNYVDGWRRLTSTFRAPEAETFSAAMTIAGVFFSPQLERGAATSPFSFFAPARAFEVLGVDEARLPRGLQTSLRARVAADVPDAAPLLLSEGFDGARAVRLRLMPGATGGTAASAAESVDENGITTTVGPSGAMPAGAFVGIGADFGAPFEACPGCLGGDAAQALIVSAAQWSDMLLVGDRERLLVADVSIATRGERARPTALEVTAGVPPSGCLDDARPDVTLVACAAGACSEGTFWQWRGEGDVVVGDAPNGGRSVRGALALEDIGLPLDEIVVELRFRAERTGTILRLSDPAGATILELAVDDDDSGVYIDDEAIGPASRRAGAAALGEWHQLVCWLGAGITCFGNAVSLSSDDSLRIAGRELSRVVVGGDDVEIGALRLWTVPANVPLFERLRIVCARNSAAFGLVMRERHALAVIADTRNQGAELDGVLVGAGWPRVVDVDGAPAYVSDAGSDESLVIAALDMFNFTDGVLEVDFAARPSDRFAVVVEEVGLGVRTHAWRMDGDDLVLDVGGAQPTRFEFPDLGGASMTLAWRDGIVTVENNDSGAAQSVNAETPFSPRALILAGPVRAFRATAR